MTNNTTNPEDVSAEELAQINHLDLFTEMRDTPSIYGRYADLYVEAERQAALAAVRCSALKARILLEYRAERKATVDEFKALVECDERYVEAQMEVIKYEAKAKAAQHRTKAIDKKLEKLRDMAIRLNTEFKIDPDVLAGARTKNPSH